MSSPKETEIEKTEPTREIAMKEIEKLKIELAREISRERLEKLNIEIEKINLEYLKNVEKLAIARDMVREKLELEIITELETKELEELRIGKLEKPGVKKLKIYI